MDLEREQRKERADWRGGGSGVEGKLYAKKRKGEKEKKPSCNITSEASEPIVFVNNSVGCWVCTDFKNATSLSKAV